MLQEQNANNQEIWHKLVESETVYIESRQNFFRECTNKVAIFQKALHSPAERGTALRLIEYLETEERQLLFDDLVDLASVSHSDIELCRQAILALPKSWLIENIETSTAQILKNGTDEEYRRLLELYIEIDLGLAGRLAKQALQHQDPDICEVGEDFDNYIKRASSERIALKVN
jgi:hypothetical protein